MFDTKMETLQLLYVKPRCLYSFLSEDLYFTKPPQNKKRPVAVLGETRPVYPDRGVGGKSWVHDTIHRDRQGWLNGAYDSECHETLSHPASARFPVYSLLRETLHLVFLAYFFANLDGIRMSLSNVWYDIWVKLSA